MHWLKFIIIISICVWLSRQFLVHARIEVWAGGPDPLENHKTLGFLSNTGPNPLENPKATNLAFNVVPFEPSSGRKRNAI